VGWFRRLRREHERDDPAGLSPYERVLRYIGKSGRSIHWDMIRLAQQSPANLAVIPLQDVLGLDNDARMNRPPRPAATGNGVSAAAASAPPSPRVSATWPKPTSACPLET
jgi:4-alpha-glucanotransferase